LKNAGIREIRVHDPMVKSDAALTEDIILTQDLRVALNGVDLVILATDHKQYRKLSKRETGDAAVYDGRGILDGTKFPGRFASIGQQRT
jgi:hypothetical protein